MIRSIHSFRGLAALLVTAGHAGSTLALAKYYDNPALAVPFAFGHIGVEFFFVLSGFLIVHVNFTDFGKAGKMIPYLAKRLLRVYPPYLIVFLAVYLTALALPITSQSVPRDVDIILKSLLLLPQAPAAEGGVGTGAPVLIVAWTLQYEIFFYIAMATFFLSKKLGFGLLLLWIYAFLFYGERVHFPASFYLSGWLWVFFVGMIAAVILRSRFANSIGPLPLVIGTLVASCLALSECVIGAEWLGEVGRLAYALSFGSIIVGAISMERAGTTILDGAVWKMLGDSSYALYLVHFPVISLALKVCVAAGIYWFIAFPGVVLLSILVGVIFHLYVEGPVLQFLRIKLGRLLS